MIVPEHIGKARLREGGIATPPGMQIRDATAAAEAARTLGGRVVLKAQVPAGKRGKSGGIGFASTPAEARERAASLLGSSVGEHRVESLLVEAAVQIVRELYVAVLNDGSTKGPLVLFSTEGGVDIEELAERAPERIVRRSIDILRGFDRATAHEIAGNERVADVLLRTYERFIALDCELLEINPLAVDSAGEVLALDCKMTIDDASRARQPELFAEIEAAVGPQGTALERRARDDDLYFIELDGDVGILANGAGLTMATIDAVTRCGGAPANFLEIGGEAYTKATLALEIVLANPKVTSVLVNFCGAFARTDVMAEGVVVACEALRPTVPFFFSIHGTGEERAIEIVRERLGIDPFPLMDDAVRAAIAASRQPAAEAARA